VGEEKGYFLLAVSFTALKVFLFLAMLRTWEKNLWSFKLQASETIYNNLGSRLQIQVLAKLDVSEKEISLEPLGQRTKGISTIFASSCVRGRCS